MNAKQLMSNKGNVKLRDKFSGAEFTVGEITIILIQMITSRQIKDADDFSDRFEIIDPQQEQSDGTHASSKC